MTMNLDKVRIANSRNKWAYRSRRLCRHNSRRHLVLIWPFRIIRQLMRFTLGLHPARITWVLWLDRFHVLPLLNRRRLLAVLGLIAILAS